MIEAKYIQINKYFTLFIVLIVLSCEPTFEAEKELEIVKQDLIVKVLDSIIAGDIDSAVEAVPDSGDIFVGYGDIVRNTKEQIRNIYEKETSQMKCEKYELLEGPTIEFIDPHNCFGTAKIKWTCFLASDSTNKKNVFVFSTLFIGRKQKNGKWVNVASAQTEKQNAVE